MYTTHEERDMFQGKQNINPGATSLATSAKGREA